jgi:hypothetical protein
MEVVGYMAAAVLFLGLIGLMGYGALRYKGIV